MPHDQLIAIKDAAPLFPSRDGKPPHLATIRRWIIAGVKGRRLPAARVGAMWYTTREWIEEFMAPSTTRDVPVQVVVERRRHEAAKARLAMRGIHVGSKEHLLSEYGL